MIAHLINYQNPAAAIIGIPAALIPVLCWYWFARVPKGRR